MEAQHYAKEIILKLQCEGYIAYYAGGWVRDYLLGHPSADIDIATNAPPEKILDLFPRTILVGLAFGVVIVSMNGYQFEVSTFRKDIEYTNGRKPTRIELSTPEKDAQRRDFTINGMFYDPFEERVIDYVHGQADLKQGIIRAIGNPYERFVEDRLRMVRAVRFAARFGFIIEPDTIQAICENADTLFPAVAIERIWQELNKMAENWGFDRAVMDLYRFGLLGVIFPQLKHVHLDEIKKRVAHFHQFPEKCPTILYLLDLVPDITEDEAILLCEYLKTGNEVIHLAVTALHARKLFQHPDSSHLHWAHFYAHPKARLLVDVWAAHLPKEEKGMFLEEHQGRQERLGPHIERLVQRKPIVTAAHLHREGIPSGKLLGILLKEAESIAVHHDLHDPQSIIELLKRSPHWPTHKGNT